MDDAYTHAFFGVVRETQEETGYQLPVHLEHYIVALLAIHIDRPNWEPKESFAESLLQAQTRRNAKELGDTCLFVTGVFPTYGSRRGLKRNYFQNIGKTSYSQVTGELFEDLCSHFDFLSDFIDLSINSPRSQIIIQSRTNY